MYWFSAAFNTDSPFLLPEILWIPKLFFRVEMLKTVNCLARISQRKRHSSFLPCLCWDQFGWVLNLGHDLCLFSSSFSWFSSLHQASIWNKDQDICHCADLTIWPFSAKKTKEIHELRLIVYTKSSGELKKSTGRQNELFSYCHCLVYSK